jgi:trigger factor
MSGMRCVEAFGEKANKMQVTETLSQGLKRSYRVVLPAGDLASRLDGQLSDMKDKVRINGFRPGKVPLAHMKRVYGRSVMGEVVQNAVNEANRKIVEDNGLRLALEPKIDFPEDKDEIEKALEAKGDLAFTVNIETLPKFDIGSFADVEITRQMTPITDQDIEEAVQRLADRNRTFTAKDGAAEKGDQLKVDFIGRMNGEEFEGGAGTDIDVVIGSDSFIPGFEEQLKGMKAGDKRTINVTFPDNYAAPNLAGQKAEFDVTAKQVAAPGAVTIDDEFAKGFGLEGLEKLKEAIRSNLQNDYDRASRDKVKRALLDVLDKKYSFELPEGLVEQEFSSVWPKALSEQQASGRSFEQDGTSEEAAKADYRRIAERRVRLGLVLAEVGDQAKVQISDDELTKALVERVRQYPGQEQAVWEYYRKTPEALAQVRAPLFEEKVVDHILAQAKVTEVSVSKEELFRAEDEKA